jgi:NADPH:quinone reductase-like Zn-dependent oxidoreductase
MESFESGPLLLEVPAPEPGPGEVLVRVGHSSLNGFDVAVAGGMLEGMMDHRFPAVLGKDFAGVVEAVGDGDSGAREGDEVFGVLMREYVGDGTFGQLVAVPESIGLAHMPSGMDPTVAGALGLAGAAAYEAIEAIAPAEGETVLIAGASGGVGSLAIQLAVARGAEVIATARPGEAADLVRGLGAAHAVDHTADLAEQVRALRSGGVDALLHFGGDGMELAELVAPGGRFASTVGVGPDQLGDLDVVATAVLAMPTREVLDHLAAEVASGALRVPVERVYKLEEVPHALKDFHKAGPGKSAIAIGEE